MNLSQLYYFKKLAELQHYTKAAKELYITQPTLSNSISSLEKELGIPLFEKDGRNVKLTRYGHEFYQYATEAIRSLEKGIALAHEHAGSPTGTIEIGTVYTIQGDYLPALIKRYRDEFGQNTSVSVYQGLTLPLIEDLENDRYEIVFTAYVPNKPDLTFVPVTSQEFVALVHRTSPLASLPAISLRDLDESAPLLTYPPATPVGKELEEALAKHGIKPSGALYNDEITLASMVESTQGAVGIALRTIGLAPFGELAAKQVEELAGTKHSICMVYKTNAYKTRAVENFIELVRSESDRSAMAD